MRGRKPQATKVIRQQEGLWVFEQRLVSGISLRRGEMGLQTTGLRLNRGIAESHPNTTWRLWQLLPWRFCRRREIR